MRGAELGKPFVPSCAAAFRPGRLLHLPSQPPPPCRPLIAAPGPMIRSRVCGGKALCPLSPFHVSFALPLGALRIDEPALGTLSG